MAEVTTALKVVATSDNTIQKTFRDIPESGAHDN